MNPNPSDTRRSGAASTTRAGDTIVIAPFPFLCFSLPLSIPLFLVLSAGVAISGRFTHYTPVTVMYFYDLTTTPPFSRLYPIMSHRSSNIPFGTINNPRGARRVCVGLWRSVLCTLPLHRTLAHSEAAGIPMMGCGDESDSALVAQFFRFPLCTYEHNAKKKRLSVE